MLALVQVGWRVALEAWFLRWGLRWLLLLLLLLLVLLLWLGREALGWAEAGAVVDGGVVVACCELLRAECHRVRPALSDAHLLQRVGVCGARFGACSLGLLGWGDHEEGRVRAVRVRAAGILGRGIGGSVGWAAGVVARGLLLRWWALWWVARTGWGCAVRGLLRGTVAVGWTAVCWLWRLGH